MYFLIIARRRNMGFSCNCPQKRKNLFIFNKILREKHRQLRSGPRGARGAVIHQIAKATQEIGGVCPAPLQKAL